uniref:Gamma-crystallin 1-like n=1 Tax=Geotrypetes seraphini TaxID=260995 RepID=A0A6P8QS19_GEOSA|nr:gamma-crystallin 1-like [Geotrypetes seraphini]
MTHFYVFQMIIFYEEKNFQGHFYECTDDCSDLQVYFSRSNSIQVQNGCWMIYEHPQYKGQQYFLRKGEYPDFQGWMGSNDSIRSCMMIPSYRGSYRLRLYERNNFGGRMLESSKDCPSVYYQFHNTDIQSCLVFKGYWIFYDQPDYRGHQYYLRPGEYRRFTDWGATNARVGSFRKIADFS